MALARRLSYVAWATVGRTSNVDFAQGLLPQGSGVPKYANSHTTNAGNPRRLHTTNCPKHTTTSARRRWIHTR